jgi:hypothetical protein
MQELRAFAYFWLGGIPLFPKVSRRKGERGPQQPRREWINLMRSIAIVTDLNVISMLHAQRLLLIFAYISIIFAMAYIGFAFTAGHFWKERNADQPKVSKNSSLIHPALHSASLRSGFPPYASLRGVRSLRPSMA